MRGPTFEVTCDLSFDSFDDVRVGRTAARSAAGELRRLARHDERVVALRCRWRRATTAAAITFRVRADRASEATELAVVMLRTSVHATGGSTSGWNQLHVAVASEARSARRQRGSGLPVTAQPSTAGSAYRAPQTWADHAAAVGRLARVPELPALAGGPPVIDLR